jgi:hypothetical protein
MSFNRTPYAADGRATVYAGEAVALELVLKDRDGVPWDLTGRSFAQRITDGRTTLLQVSADLEVLEENGVLQLARFVLTGEQTAALLPTEEGSARDLRHQILEVGGTVFCDAVFQVRTAGLELPAEPSAEVVIASAARFELSAGDRNRLTVSYLGSPGRSSFLDLFNRGTITAPTAEAFEDWIESGAGDAETNAVAIIRDDVIEARNTLRKMSAAVNSGDNAVRAEYNARADRHLVDVTTRGVKNDGTAAASNKTIIRQLMAAGERLFFPAGLYKIDGALTGYSDMWLEGAGSGKTVIEADFSNYIFTGGSAGAILRATIRGIEFRHSRLPADTPPGPGVGTNSILKDPVTGASLGVIKGRSGGFARAPFTDGRFKDLRLTEFFAAETEEFAGGGGAILWLGRHTRCVHEECFGLSPAATGCGGERIDAVDCEFRNSDYYVGDDARAYTLGQADQPSTYFPGRFGGIRNVVTRGGKSMSRKARGENVGIGLESRGNRVQNLITTDRTIGSQARAGKASSSSANPNKFFIWRVDDDTSIAFVRRLGRHGAIQFRAPETFIEPETLAEVVVNDPVLLSNSDTPGYNGKTIIPRAVYRLNTSKRTDLTLVAVDVPTKRYKLVQEQAVVDADPAKAFDAVFADLMFLVPTGLPLALRSTGFGGGPGVPIVALAISPTELEFQQVNSHRSSQATLVPGPLPGANNLGVSVDSLAFFLFDTADLGGTVPPTFEARAAMSATRLDPSFGENIVYERVRIDHRYEINNNKDVADDAPAWSVNGPFRGYKWHVSMVGKSTRTLLQCGGAASGMDVDVTWFERIHHDRPVLQIRDVSDSFKRNIYRATGPAPLTAPVFDLTRSKFYADTSEEGDEEDDDVDDAEVPVARGVTLCGRVTDIVPGTTAALVRATHGIDVVVEGLDALPAAGFTGKRPLFDLTPGALFAIQTFELRGFDFRPWLTFQTLAECFINPAGIPVRFVECPGAEASDPVAALLRGGAPEASDTLAKLDAQLAPVILKLPKYRYLSTYDVDPARPDNQNPINTAIAETIAAGETLLADPGLFPCSAAIMAASGLSLELHERCEFSKRFASLGSGGLITQASFAQRIQGVRIIGGRLSTQDTTLHTGNMVSLLCDDLTIREMVIREWQGRAFLVAGDRIRLSGIDARSVLGKTYQTGGDPSNGGGAIRFAGGRDFKCSDSHVECGDDCYMFVPGATGVLANIETLDSSYVNCTGWSYNARLFLAALEGVGMTTSIRRVGFHAIRGKAGTRGFIVSNYHSTGVIEDIDVVGCSIDMSGDLTGGNSIQIRGDMGEGVRDIRISGLTVKSPYKEVLEVGGGPAGLTDRVYVDGFAFDAPRASAIRPVDWKAASGRLANGVVRTNDLVNAACVIVGTGGFPPKLLEISGVQFEGITNLKYGVQVVEGCVHINGCQFAELSGQTTARAVLLGPLSANCIVQDNKYDRLTSATRIVDQGTNNSKGRKAVLEFTQEYTIPTATAGTATTRNITIAGVLASDILVELKWREAFDANLFVVQPRITADGNVQAKFVNVTAASIAGFATDFTAVVMRDLG